MDRIKLIIKAVMFYITAFSIILFIAGIESTIDNGLFLPLLLANTVMVYSCYELISLEEFEKITLYKYFNRLIEE